jgi:hypothetical protein
MEIADGNALPHQCTGVQHTLIKGDKQRSPLSSAGAASIRPKRNPSHTGTICDWAEGDWPRLLPGVGQGAECRQYRRALSQACAMRFEDRGQQCPRTRMVSISGDDDPIHDAER